MADTNLDDLCPRVVHRGHEFGRETLAVAAAALGHFWRPTSLFNHQVDTTSTTGSKTDILQRATAPVPGEAARTRMSHFFSSLPLTENSSPDPGSVTSIVTTPKCASTFQIISPVCTQSHVGSHR